jgi:quercetin dioxygenase-like cupin family protein
MVANEWHMGALMRWHVTGKDSGDQLALGEVIVARGGEPPLHVHAREDEVWFVIEGEVTFQRGPERIEARAGDAVVLPRGVVHGFAVRTPSARILHMYTPSGIERAFKELSTAAAGPVLPPPAGAPSPEMLSNLEETYGRYGVTFVGPPLAVLLAREGEGAHVPA